MEAKRALQRPELAASLTSAHIHALFEVATLLHVHFLPSLLSLLTTHLDGIFGSLHATVLATPPPVVAEGDSIPVLFHHLQQQLALSPATLSQASSSQASSSQKGAKESSQKGAKESPQKGAKENAKEGSQEGSTDSSQEGFEEVLLELVVVSNAYHFLQMLELHANQRAVLNQNPQLKALLAKTDATVQTLRATAKGGAPQSLLIDHAAALQQRAARSEHAVSYTLPLFGRVAQMLSLDEAFCEHLPFFVDRFVFSLFARLETLLGASRDPAVLLPAVVFACAFLLTVARGLAKFIDGSECMRVGEARGREA